jgi:hypothetical protein
MDLQPADQIGHIKRRALQDGLLGSGHRTFPVEGQLRPELVELGLPLGPHLLQPRDRLLGGCGHALASHLLVGGADRRGQVRGFRRVARSGTDGDGREVG